MRFYRFFLLLFLAATAAYAQQTGITGKVTDPSGSVLVGAIVEAAQSGGAKFEATTNSQGIYVFPALTATDYVITVRAEGFSTVQKTLTLLVGQMLENDLQLPVANASTIVMVQAENASIDTTSSQVAGNVTPDDVKTLPINGRNYMELATLVPGVRVNAVTNGTPLGTTNSGKFQILMDGLQVTQDTADASFGQPQFSQDAISQFQIVTNRFDATLGRSSGVYVNVQSKQGNNDLHGSAFGYFRDSSFNAADPIAHKVLPFQDQQYGGTFGGPIKKNKAWYFGSYEGEHQPSTSVATPAQTGVQFTHPATFTVNEYLGRGDYEINAKNHLLVRASGFTYNNNYLGISGTTDPSTAYAATRMNYGLLGTLSTVVSDTMLNEFRAGFNHFQWQNLPLVASQQLKFPLVTIGGAYNYPQIFYQGTPQFRDDFFYSKGRHSLRFGAEYLYTKHTGYFQQNVRGVATCGANPTNWAAAFPNTNDPSTWNYSLISAACAGGAGESFVQGFGNFNLEIPRNQLGFWAQDDWKILSRLTINLGIRYDNDLGVFNPGLKLNNGLQTPTANDNHQFAPRIGFAWDPIGSGKTVLRGGAGIYFADIAANQVIDEQIFNGVRTLQASISGNSKSPIDLTNPFNGATTQQIQANASLYRQAVQPLAPNVLTPYSAQMTFGVQQELPLRITLAADYVHTRVYHDWIRLNANLLPDASHPGFNLNPNTKNTATGLYNVPLQNFTQINQFNTPDDASSIYDGLQMAIRKMMSRGFTAGVAYTFSRYKNSAESPFYYPNKPFINGIHDEWANSADDQRHTLTVNGNYQWKYGLSLSSLYHFGSGQAFPSYLSTASPTGYSPTYNRTFAATPVPYTAADAGKTCQVASGLSSCVYTYNDPKHDHLDTASGYYITDRDALYGRAVHRIDSRLQETVKVHDRYRAILGIEAFNLFNHSNYGNYNGYVNSSSYGAPLATSGNPVEYQARSLQFSTRLEF